MDRIGRYRIIGEIGRGAMGIVYRATDPSIGRDVAIKTVRLDAAGEAHDKLKERLFREARSAGVLSHPSIVTIYDMGEEEGLAYVAMGLVKGPSLEALLAKSVPLTGPQMFSILRQTAAALDYAHSRGVVHRDIKPGNIMTDEDGSVKITDFGIARFAAAERLNETGTITGTPNYMSPEQVQGLDADGRTDQFSLGVVAWEILTGEKPFSGDNLSTVVYRIVSEDPLPAQHLNGTLTPRIDEVLRRVLAKDPAKRFANCAGFVGALEMACAESPGWTPVAAGSTASLPTVETHWQPPTVPTVSPAPPPGPVTSPPPHRRRLWPWVLAAGLALGVGGIVWWQSTMGHPRETSTARAAPQIRQPDPGPEVAPKVNSDPIPLPPAPAEPIRSEPEREPQPAPPASPGRLQDIRVATSPAGAHAVLDGNAGLSCETPCVLHGRPGTHHLRISLPGYRNEYRELHVADTTLDLPDLRLQAVLGTLMLTSTPDGASITVNGTLVPQTTPAELPLKPGSYQLVIEKGGMRHAETVRIGESTVYLKVTLRP